MTTRATAGRLPVRAIVTVGTGLVLAALPVFLVGGLAVQIRRDLQFGGAALGAAVSGAFLFGAVTAPLVGRLVDRLGARIAILLGAACSVASASALALLADGWSSIALSLAVAGVGFSFMDPGLAVLVTRTVPRHRQGLAFGIKEAAVPGATLVAGLAIPAIVVTFGWRWAFALVALPAGALLVLLGGPSSRRDRRLDRQPRSTGMVGDRESVAAGRAPDGGRPVPASTAGSARGSPRTPPSPPRALLVAIAVSAALGSAAGSGISVFLTESATAIGLGESAAGLLLAGGSVAGIVARVGAGLRADRRPASHLGLMAAMLAIGAATMLVGAAGTVPTLVVGTVGAFAGGWGWSGLLFLSLVRLSPAAPAAATGIGLSGLAVGNAVGPLGFGVIAQEVSYAMAWVTAAALAAVAAVILVTVDRRPAPAPVPAGSDPATPHDLP